MLVGGYAKSAADAHKYERQLHPLARWLPGSLPGPPVGPTSSKRGCNTNMRFRILKKLEKKILKNKISCLGYNKVLSIYLNGPEDISDKYPKYFGFVIGIK